MIAAGESLLKPRYYYSPQIDPETMHAEIGASFQGRRNPDFPPFRGTGASLGDAAFWLQRYFVGQIDRFQGRSGSEKTMKSLNADHILLVHPLGYRAEAAGSDISRLANIMPPLGLASIAAYLEREGIEVRIVDCFAHPDDQRVIVDSLRALRPAFIGFSCTTSSFLDGVRLAGLARAELPGIRTVFGGPHVSALREQVLRDYPEVDFAVVGEGEETLLELIRSGAEGAETIPGLVCRVAGEPVFTGYRPQGIDLDSLPFPAYEKLAGYPEAYRLPIFNYPKAPNTSCISSRGCPYACSYCDRSVFRRSFRYNSADYLYAHLRYLQGALRHPPRQLLRRPVHLSTASGSRPSAPC